MPGGKEAVPPPSELVLIKLASLAVHVQEEAEDQSRPDMGGLDRIAARGLASDPDVTGWLATVDPALLPVKR